MQLLQRERAEEEHRDHQGRGHEDQAEPAQHRPPGEQGRVHEGRGGRAQVAREQHVPDDADEQRDQGRRAEPPVVAGRDEPVHDGGGRGGGEGGAEDVEPAARPGPRPHPPGQGRQQQRPDRDVHPEHPRPARARGQDAAQEHADGGARAAERRPDADGARQLGPAERAHDDGQRGGRHGRRAHALQAAGDEQQLGGPRQPGEQRGDGEQREAGEHDAARPQDVGGLAAQQHQPAEDEGVHARHPGQAGAVEAEVGAHLGERDRDDGDVDDEHQLGDAEQREDAPAPGVGRGGLVLRGLVLRGPFLRGLVLRSLRGGLRGGLLW